jgi:hypothetical protein
MECGIVDYTKEGTLRSRGTIPPHLKVWNSKDLYLAPQNKKTSYFELKVKSFKIK